MLIKRSIFNNAFEKLLIVDICTVKIYYNFIAYSQNKIRTSIKNTLEILKMPQKCNANYNFS